jgi:hypothetical protein
MGRERQRAHRRGVELAQDDADDCRGVRAAHGAFGFSSRTSSIGTASRARTAFEFVTMLSFAMPGTVVGISYILAFNAPPIELAYTASSWSRASCSAT